jgi:hypothetical protein
MVTAQTAGARIRRVGPGNINRRKPILSFPPLCDPIAMTTSRFEGEGFFIG